MNWLNIDIMFRLSITRSEKTASRTQVHWLINGFQTAKVQKNINSHKKNSKKVAFSAYNYPKNTLFTLKITNPSTLDYGLTAFF